MSRIRKNKKCWHCKKKGFAIFYVTLDRDTKQFNSPSVCPDFPFIAILDSIWSCLFVVISNYLALGKLRVLKEGMWSSELATITWEVLGAKNTKQNLASAKIKIYQLVLTDPHVSAGHQHNT